MLFEILIHQPAAMPLYLRKSYAFPIVLEIILRLRRRSNLLKSGGKAANLFYELRKSIAFPQIDGHSPKIGINLESMGKTIKKSKV